jgi:hypothetical protein
MDGELIVVCIVGVIIACLAYAVLYVRSRTWVSIREEAPEVGQRVWYYFDAVGVWRGHYRGLGEHGHEFECDERFGFLSGDVTHWKPYRNEKKRPQPPMADDHD